MNSKTIIGIAIGLLVLALVIIFVPLETVVPAANAARMELVDRIFSIITPIASLGMFLFGLKNRKEEQKSISPSTEVEGNHNVVAIGGSIALGEKAQQINHSTINGDVVGPGGSSRNVNIKGGVKGSTIITGDNNKVEKK